MEKQGLLKYIDSTNNLIYIPGQSELRNEIKTHYRKNVYIFISILYYSISSDQRRIGTT